MSVQDGLSVLPPDLWERVVLRVLKHVGPKGLKVKNLTVNTAYEATNPYCVVLVLVCKAFKKIVTTNYMPQLKTCNDLRNSLVTDFFAFEGSLSLIKWALHHNWCMWDGSFGYWAARGGHEHVLNWLIENDNKLDPRVCDGAARGGFFKILHEYVSKKKVPVTSESTCAAAARGGHLVVLQWAYNNGFALNDHVLFCAVKSGNLQVVQWCISKGCAITDKSYVDKVAAKTGSVDILMELENLGMKKFSSEACSIAAKKGHLNVLQWANLKGVDLKNARVCANAAEFGHFNILQWARVIDLPWDERTCNEAAESGNIEILKWAHSNGCPWNSRVCLLLAARGDLATLKWAREEKCPWDSNTCLFASSAGHLSVLKWAHANGCELAHECTHKAARHGHFGVLKYLHENGCKCDSTTAIEAARGGYLEILQWLVTLKEVSWDDLIYKHAAVNGYLHVIKWAYALGKTVPPKIGQWATSCRNPELITWLEEKGFSSDV